MWILFRNVVLARNLNSSFDTHEAAQYAVDYLSGLKLDGQTIRVEMDWGYSDGRQYGRASNGGQMRHYINDIKNSAKSYTSIRIMIVITTPMIVGIHTGRETAETAMVIVRGDGIIRVC